MYRNFFINLLIFGKDLPWPYRRRCQRQRQRRPARCRTQCGQTLGSGTAQGCLGTRSLRTGVFALVGTHAPGYPDVAEGGGSALSILLSVVHVRNDQKRNDAVLFPIRFARQTRQNPTWVDPGQARGGSGHETS